MWNTITLVKISGLVLMIFFIHMLLIFWNICIGIYNRELIIQLNLLLIANEVAPVFIWANALHLSSHTLFFHNLKLSPIYLFILPTRFCSRHRGLKQEENIVLEQQSKCLQPFLVAVKWLPVQTNIPNFSKKSAC